MRVLENDKSYMRGQNFHLGTSLWLSTQPNYFPETGSISMCLQVSPTPEDTAL